MMAKRDLLFTLLAIAFVVISESIPFFYNDAYTVKDMKWGWIISIPIIIFFKHLYDSRKKDNVETE